MSLNTIAEERDYAYIDSVKIAEELAEKGNLEKVFLLPKEFGGEDIVANIVYVPLGVFEIKEQLTQTIISYVQEDIVNRIEVLPTYKGDSFIPATIEIKTWHSEKEGSFNPTISIW